MTPTGKQGKPQVEFLPTEVQAEFLGEWFKGCTIGKCSVEARAFLAQRGQSYFWKYAKALNATEACLDIVAQTTSPGGADDDEADGEDASERTTTPPGGFQTEDASLRERPWVLFESYMCVPKPSGKRPKDGILKACAEHQTNASNRVRIAFEYISQSFRSFVRHWVHKEGGELRNSKGWIMRRTVTEVHSDDESESPVSIYEFIPSSLPDPAQESQLALLNKTAEEISASLWPQLADPVRVAFAARVADVSLADPRVEERAGRKHSQLSGYLQPQTSGTGSRQKSNLPALITREIAKRVPGIERELQTYMKGQVLGFLMGEIKKWLQCPENRAFLCFLRTEGEDLP